MLLLALTTSNSIVVIVLWVRFIGVLLASMPLLGSTPLDQLVVALQLSLMTNTLIVVDILWVWMLGAGQASMSLGSTPLECLMVASHFSYKFQLACCWLDWVSRNKQDTGTGSPWSAHLSRQQQCMVSKGL